MLISLFEKCDRWLSRKASAISRFVCTCLMPHLNKEDSQAALRAFLDPHRRNLNVDDCDLDNIANFSSYDRDMWVQSKLKQIPDGANVLDAGAGQCRYKPFLAHTQYKAQDFSQYLGSENGPLKETWTYGMIDYVCDIAEIPVEAATFDAVLCTEVLEHVPNPILAVKELLRVLKPGGTLILTVPLGSGVHQEPYHYYGGFSPYFFRHHLNEFGAEVKEILPIGGLLRHVAQEMYRVARIVEGSDSFSHLGFYVLQRWLPKMLAELDSKHFVEQFTVGYLIEARKR